MTTTLTLLTAPTTREELTDQMEADGFVAGKPSHVSNATLDIDRQAAAETPCECGNADGLEFLPFKPRDRRQMGGYRCLVWCCQCDQAFEL